MSLLVYCVFSFSVGVCLCHFLLPFNWLTLTLELSKVIAVGVCIDKTRPFYHHLHAMEMNSKNDRSTGVYCINFGLQNKSATFFLWNRKRILTNYTFIYGRSFRIDDTLSYNHKMKTITKCRMMQCGRIKQKKENRFLVVCVQNKRYIHDTNR